MIARVPQRARGAVAAQLHRRRVVLAHFAALRIEVDGEDVEQALPAGDLGAAELIEQPGEVVHAAVRIAIGEARPVVCRRPLLVVAAVEVAGPAPLLRSGNEHGRIDRLHAPRCVDVFRRHFVHRRAGGMHVAMRFLPQARLVVEDDVADVPLEQMLDPAELIGRVDLHVGVVRIVGRDSRAVGAHSVAGVGHERIGGLLRPVLGHRVAGELLAARAEPGHPTHRGDGDHRLAAGVARKIDEAVHAVAGLRSLLADRLEEPIGRAIARVGYRREFVDAPPRYPSKMRQVGS